MSRVAERLSPPVSADAAWDCIDRLEKHYRTVLVRRAVKKSGTNTLSEEGRALAEHAVELARRLQQTLHWSPGTTMKQSLRVATSQMLLAHVFPPALSAYL